MGFPMVCCEDPFHKEALPPSHALVPFILHHEPRYLLLTAQTVTFVITPTGAKHRLSRAAPAGSLAAATHANVQPAQALCTMPGRTDMVCSWSLTPQIQRLLRGSQCRS